ncbi:MAG: hypothetical protein M1829_005782 [Trizodia sp. TS-e1964]|nr:MAG: hypothetical protein M1829_005782 [Trizodia sp. TS-e1964]
MAAQICVRSGCGREYTDAAEECQYHPGPPIFHEGQKGWKCCKPRVLTFEEFQSLPGCARGLHTTLKETPIVPAGGKAAEKATLIEPEAAPTPPVQHGGAQRMPLQPTTSAPVPAPPESDSDDAAIPIPAGQMCRRRGCNTPYTGSSSPEGEKCIYHPGYPLFHEGSKGWTCCKRKVLDFDDFLKLEGCGSKPRHLFVGSGREHSAKPVGEEAVESVRHDFYQTSSTIIASLYLKKIAAPKATIVFSSPSTIDLDLPTTDNKRYKTQVPLYAKIDADKSHFRIMGTKLELTLVKADTVNWPVLRSDEQAKGKIIQVGSAARV